jgi:hypothetical protein
MCRSPLFPDKVVVLFIKFDKTAWRLREWRLEPKGKYPWLFTPDVEKTVHPATAPAPESETSATLIHDAQ